MLTKKAFTIFEVLIASMLLIVFIVVFYISIMHSFGNLQRIMELRAASLILQERISIIRNLTFDQINALGGTFTSSAMGSLQDASGTIEKSSYCAGGKIIKITLRVNWTSFDSRAKDASIVTLITEDGIDKK